MRKPTFRRKATISGRMVELLEFYYIEPIKRGRSSFSFEELAKRKELKRSYNSGEVVPDMEKIRPSLSRSRTKLRRIIYSNAWIWKDRHGNIIPAKFLTLTFQENINDLKTANRYLSKYIQRLNDHFKNNLADPLKYVCVPEFQKRGAVHYHLVLFNFPFVDRVYKKLRDIWGGHRIELKTINRKGDVGYVVWYISKYISKQSSDGRFWGQKRYFASRGLLAPIILRDDIAIEMLLQRIRVFEKSKLVFDIPYCGEVKYYLYDLGENKNVKSLSLLDPYVKEKIKESEKIT